MTGPQHERRAEDVGAYLLDALEPEEAHELERHAAGCALCRDELVRLRGTVDALARSVQPVPPPGSLRAAVMRAAADDPPPTALAAHAQRRRGRARALLGRRAVLVAAAASFVVGTGIGLGVARLAEPGARTLAVTVDRTRLPEGSASLEVLDSSEPGAVLHVHGLEPAGAGRVYQVWLQRGTELVPGSLFVVRSDGEGAAAVTDDLEDVDAVLVTRERAGGARAPTESPVLSVAV